jgi:bifunctional NMN adenylyltransferase/nudix hydrolase
MEDTHNRLGVPRETADVGVIVGRFQVANLHQGHRDLIQTVINESERTIIFLGLSPLKTSKINPLDFEARKQMLQDEYPDVTIAYIKDKPSDEVWSKDLDEQISNLTGPNKRVVLYGSRDAFISHYHGRYETIELRQEVFISGTATRNKIGKTVKADPAFREGVIWATHNQYPNPKPTVDIAIFDSNDENILLAKKFYESKLRFIGGFVDKGETTEQAAVREVSEETSGIEIGGTDGLTYEGSFVIDDWRYRSEEENILTTLFTATHLFGRPEPRDDIAELHWVSIKDLAVAADKGKLKDLVEAVHIPMMKHILRDYETDYLGTDI